MDLLLKLTDCTLTFASERKTSFIYASFNATSNSLSITTYESKRIIYLDKGSEEGRRIDVHMIASEIENGVHGNLSEILGLGIEINLFCSSHQMNELLNFVASGMSPNEVKIELIDAEKSFGGFIMTKNNYEISSWRFQISTT